MRNLAKFLGFIAIMAIIGFSLISCKDGVTDAPVTIPDMCSDCGKVICECIDSPIIEVTVEMWDSYGDDWDGNGALRINVNGTNLSPYAKASGSKSYYYFDVLPCDEVSFFWIEGSNQSENAFAVYYNNEQPDPPFNPNSSEWSPANDPNGRVLLYRQYNTMDNVSNGTLLGSFTVTGSIILCNDCWQNPCECSYIPPITGEKEITIAMWDSSNDGWDTDAALRININGANLSQNARLNSGGGPGYYTFNVNLNDVVNFYWVNGGQYDYECAFAIYYSDNPPNPSFNPNSSSWSPANDPNGKVLIYKQFSNSGSVGNGTQLGSLTVSGNSNVTPTVEFEITLAAMSEWELTDQTAYVATNTNRIFTVNGTYSTYRWYLDGALINSSSSYTFNKPNGVYQLMIVVTNSTGDSRSGRCWVTVSATPLAYPNTPSSVTATATSSNSITVSWNSVSGATGYKIYRSSSSSGTFTEVGTSTTTSYINTGLAASTTYYYRVAAYNNIGTGSQSSVVNVATLSNVSNNTTQANASNIQLNIPVHVDLTTSSKMSRWYIFTASTSGIYYFSTSNESNNAFLTFVSSSGTDGTYNDGRPAILTRTFTAGETIYIRAEMLWSSSETGSFTLTVTNSIITTYPITSTITVGGLMYTGTLGAGQTQYIRVSLNAGSTYRIRWNDSDNTTGYADIMVGLINESTSTTVQAMTDNSSSNNFTYTVPSGASGNYLIAVQGYNTSNSGTYAVGCAIN